jgi:hypothetical protein
LAAIPIAVAAIAVIPRSQGEQIATSERKLEVVGLSAYGVEIVGSKDPTFSKLNPAKQSVGQSLTSVLVVNNSEQAIASCTVRWEILLRSGQTRSHFRTKTGSLDTVLEGGRVRLAEGIASRGTIPFSVTDSPSLESQESSGVNFRTGGGGAKITDLLSDSVKVTISVDGVLFVDGTFAGPDINNYFERSRGQLVAKRELAAEILQLISGGAGPEEITSHLKKVGAYQANDDQIPPGEDSQYALGKWMQKSTYARLLLLLDKEKGHQAVLDRVKAELDKPQITLRKLAQS